VTVPNLNRFRGSFLKASTFSARALDYVEDLDDAQVHCRSQSRDVKYLLEEVLPLAYFVRFFDLPERRVRCKYLGGTERDVDAELLLTGRQVELQFAPPRLWVEVTSAQFPKEHLRREALGLYGAVFIDPNIKREGPTIVSRPTVVDGETPVHNATKWLSDAVSKKLSQQYPDPCALLVRMVVERHLTIGEWSGVAEAIAPLRSQSSFHAIYVVEDSTGCVFRAG
jgi:hypothetical protein